MSSMENENTKVEGTENIKKKIVFAAINRFVESKIVSPVEKATRDKGHEMIYWGERNNYPDYLLGLYNNVATLRSVINGCVDFVVGDDVTTTHNLQNDAMNMHGDTIRDIVKWCACDYFLYGGFALEVIRDNRGEVAEVYYCDLCFLRTNKDCNVFYYSEEYTEKYRRSVNILTYPAFMKDTSHPSSILFVKNTHKQVYPAPLYAASVKGCEIERSIDTYHLNAIDNGFVASAFFNFNNGTPSDEVKEEITTDIQELFTGAENAARVGCSWNEDKEHATEIIQFKVEDFASQYDALSKRSRQEIFTAFRANPNLFGIPTESLGFSSEEYESAFRLFNRTQIKPVQDLITDSFDKIFGEKNSIVITPFSLGNMQSA